jgi:hypothetical protein
MAAPALADIEVTLSGQVEFGASIFDEEAIDDSNRGYFFFMDSETNIVAEGATDNGVNYSSKVELEVDADGQGDTGGDVNADEAVLAFWGGFGRVELGREDGAEDIMFVGGEDFQAGTGGVDGDPVNLSFGAITHRDTADAAKVTYYSPRVAGFQAGASYTPDTGDGQNASDDDAGDLEDHLGLGVNFTTGAAGADITVSAVASLGDDEVDSDDDVEDYAIGLGLEFAGLGIGGSYILREEQDEGNGYVVGAKYGFGPANVSLGYGKDDPDEGDGFNLYVASFDYGLFPGVTLKGDVSYNDEDPDSADGDETTAGVVTVQLNY